MSFSFSNAWKNKWILFSGTAAICLFGVAPSMLGAGLGICSLLALIFVCLTRELTRTDNEKMNIIAMFAVISDFALMSGFVDMWLPSRQLAALAGRFGLSAKSFLLILAAAGGLAALYFLYAALSAAVKGIERLFNIHLNTERSSCTKNIKSNWYILVSAFAFFCLESLTYRTTYNVIIGLACIVLISSQKNSILSSLAGKPITLKIFAVLSAIGMCLAGKRAFCNYWGPVIVIIPHGMSALQLLSALFSVVGLLFAFLLITVILDFVRQKISEFGIISRISALEWVVYGAVFVLLVALTAFAFTQSQAFYGTDYPCDIIYTSDSPMLVKTPADLYLSHKENDLRQPLFAVFAAPFTGWMYLIAVLLSKVLCISDGVFYTLTNAAQIALLLGATILLADMMTDRRDTRLCFFLLLCSSYTMLLSVLMMEQYIVGYFWLIFALYSIRRSSGQNALAYCGATGTMLTSGIIFLAYCPKLPGQKWRDYCRILFVTGVKAAIGFAALLAVLGRFDVIYTLAPQINSLVGFAGGGVTTSEKLLQYISFTANCFVSPNAGVDTVSMKHISWQLAPVVRVNALGVGIIALSALSFAIGRKDPAVRTAGLWALFSVAVLFVLGWGTAENGLILYSLYFCWAFYSLLFKLLETLCERLRLKWLLYAACALLFAVLLWFNIPGIGRMLAFAAEYYPA